MLRFLPELYLAKDMPFSRYTVILLSLCSRVASGFLEYLFAKSMLGVYSSANNRREAISSRYPTGCARESNDVAFDHKMVHFLE